MALYCIILLRCFSLVLSLKVDALSWENADSVQSKALSLLSMLFPVWPSTCWGRVGWQEGVWEVHRNDKKILVPWHLYFITVFPLISRSVNAFSKAGEILQTTSFGLKTLSTLPTQFRYSCCCLICLATDDGHNRLLVPSEETIFVSGERRQTQQGVANLFRYNLCVWQEMTGATGGG